MQGTAGAQRWDLMLPNLGTIGYHCKETAGSQRLKLIVPNLKNDTLPVQGTADSPKVRTHGSVSLCFFSEPVAERFVCSMDR